MTLSPSDAARSAWDAALCALQSIMFDTDGKLLTATEISAAASRLHSWATEPKDEPATATTP